MTEIAGHQVEELLSLAWWHGAQSCNLPEHHKVPRDYHARTAKLLRDIARQMPWISDTPMSAVREEMR